MTRTIRESKQVEESLRKKCEDIPRLSDAWLGISWRLSRGPEHGYEFVEGHYVIRFPTFSVADLPSITVLYHFDDEYVDVTGIGFNL